MEDDERHIATWLEAYTLRVEKFSKNEKRQSKTPDFRVFKENELVFYCEVKTISRDGWVDEQLEGAPPLTIVGGTRPDPIYNRLTDDIHKAVQQFDAVNPEKEYPNVLAFVNHDGVCGFNDLLSVITGNFDAEDGGRDPIFSNFSHGRIIEEKRRVDLYYWKDDSNPERFFFTDLSNSEVIEKLCGYFEMDPANIRKIPS